jgi:tight adherence protein B
VVVVTALAAVLGLLAAGGLCLVVAGLRGVDPMDWRPSTSSRQVAGADRLLVRIAAAVGAGVLVAALTGWPVGALLAAAGAWVLPSMTGAKVDREASLAKVEGIAAWAEMLRDTMAAAGGLEQSILASATVAPPAIRQEVQSLALRLERQRLTPALRAFAEELDDPTADLVVAALVLAADKSPKRLGDLLGSLASAARSEVSMRLRVDAGRARTRTSVRVVTISTTAFALGLLVLNRGYLSPYDTALGQVVLALVGGLFAGAFWWLAQSSKVDAGERFLRGAAERRLPEVAA